MGMFLIVIMVMVSMRTDVSELIKLYALHKCSLLYVNYILIKL